MSFVGTGAADEPAHCIAGREATASEALNSVCFIGPFNSSRSLANGSFAIVSWLLVRAGLVLVGLGVNKVTD